MLASGVACEPPGTSSMTPLHAASAKTDSLPRLRPCPLKGGTGSWNAVPSHNAVSAEANSEALHGAGVE